MLPPIENSVLQSNPKFALLHSTLSKNVLDPSGATKNHPAQKEREAVSESLKVARIQAAKSYLVRNALRNLDLSSPTSSKSKSKPQQSSLPPELIELILILSSHLSTPNLPRTSKALLESTEQWATLATYLPQISMLVSAHLHAQALGLARILSPTSNPSFLHRQIPKLIPSICDQQAEISNKKLELERHRTDLVSMTTTLLGLYHMAITFIIHILEQNKHGAIARNAKIRAEYLSLSAQKEAVEAKILFGKGEKMVYTEEVKGALTNYVLNLRDGRDRLKEKRRMLEKQLWSYGVGREDALKEKTMREIARVYEGMMREIEEVGRDVERLRGR